ncbi:MAG: response regulator transcription factor [Deltaproteobacteria bacterium]|nr:response regulator transcription factor [Deltaproteobacteria bacterium]
MDSKYRVLVIDDDSQVRDAIKFALSSRFTVTTAATGNEGLRLARLEQPDLILLDLLMPERDGIAICRILRADQDTRAIPVIMLTGSDDDEMRAKALSSGADDLVSKPFRPKEFSVRIEQTIREIKTRPRPALSTTCGNLTLDPSKVEARVNGRRIDLSILEFSLLEPLRSHPEP